MTFDALFATILRRKKDMPERSYTASLFRAGKNRILQKVGEEAVEVVVAASTEGKKRLIAECADLLFHFLVLLVYNNISLDDIRKELEKRK